MKGVLNIGATSNPTLDKKSEDKISIYQLNCIGIEVLRNKVKSVSKMLKMFRVLR